MTEFVNIARMGGDCGRVLRRSVPPQHPYRHPYRRPVTRCGLNFFVTLFQERENGWAKHELREALYEELR